MNAQMVRIATLSLFGLVLTSAPAGAIERKVDCDKGQSIQQVLDTAPNAAGDRFEISVSGTCEEIVIIRRNAVSIEGDATIVGGIRVFQASDVWLYDLTVTGPGIGIGVAGSNSLRLTGIKLIGNDGHGLTVSSRGLAWLRFGTTISENGGSGVYVEDGSLRIDDASITNNQGNGVEAMIGNVVASRTATISGNMNHGIVANFHSSVLMRGAAEVSGNQAHGVNLEFDSGLLMFDAATTRDNADADVFCSDTESSAKFFGAVPGQVACTGFDQVGEAGPVPDVTFEWGSALHPAGTIRDGDDGTYVSETDDPLGPFWGLPVHFRGTEAGGQPQVYRYRLDFDEDVQLRSVAISGAAWWGSVIRVLDQYNNELARLDVTPPAHGSNSFQTVVVNIPGVTGSTFYLEEFNSDSDWRYRSDIVVNAY